MIFLVLFLFSTVPAWAMGHVPIQSEGSPLIGKAAPDAVLPKSDGTSASILSSRQGHKAILVFWATWCPHCYEDMGNINSNFKSIEQNGIRIILVDIGESKESVQEYFIRRQMNLKSFIDEDSTMQTSYRLIGVPTLVFIDEKGIIRNVTHLFPSGYTNYFIS